MKRRLLSFTFLMLIAIPVLPQPRGEGHGDTNTAAMTAAASIEAREIEAHVRFLASDLLEGRATGSRGHEIAARYVASQFLASGLAPGGDDESWFQEVPLRSANLTGATLAFAAPSSPWKKLEPRTEFVTVADPKQTESTVEGRSVFVGFGITAPELGWDDYADVDVKGKIVIALRNAPSTFPSSQRAHHASTAQKRRNAVRHGAIALIELATPKEESRVPWKVLASYSDHPTVSWVRDDGEIHEGLAGLEAHARVSRKGAERLFEGTQPSLGDLLERADEGRDLVSFELPHRIRITARSEHENLTSPNVIGILPGSDPNLRDEFVVLVAHLDHVGVGKPQNGDAIYNGAYDNASGVAALIAVGRALASLEVQPARSIALLAVTGEERGLLGADYFAHHPTAPIGDIVAATSLDMFLMLFPLNDVVAYGAEHSSLGEDIAKVADALGIALSPDPTPEEVLFVRTDHYAFVRQGIPSLYLDHGLDSGDPAVDGAALVRNWMRTHYHAPSDDLDQPFDWQAGADFARLNLLFAWEVASNPERPRWNDGDYFGTHFGSQ